MGLKEVVFLAASLLAVVWIALAAGVFLVRRGSESAGRFRTWLLNKRIAQFQFPPFRVMLRLWLGRRFLATAISFLLLIIAPAVLLFFLLGICLVTPLLAVYQGFVVGLLVARYNRRNMIWALTIGLFESGYWVLAGALGMAVTVGTLFAELSFADSFVNVIRIFLSGYWIPIAVCVLINAFGEVAGPIYWKVEGPISLEALAKGEPVSNDESQRRVH